jgi:cytochrome c oxidase assembly protein subunit 15
VSLKITTADNSINPTPVRRWLFACAFMVFAMIVIGAITRLTESGLSMVEWKPLIGAIPPLNDAEWNRVFDLYKQSPEFIKKNFWMELPDFKNIFFWEWLHRLWGRLIGLIFALPLAFFWLRGSSRMATNSNCSAAVARRRAGFHGLVHGQKRPRR